MIAGCSFIYACAAVAILILVVAINSQGSSGSVPILAIFAIALFSPAPMLLVGVLFFTGNRWATPAAVGLALFHVVTLAVQLHLARGTFIGQLPTARALLFYLFAAQTFYLPGSVVLAISSLALTRRGV